MTGVSQEVLRNDHMYLSSDVKNTTVLKALHILNFVTEDCAV